MNLDSIFIVEINWLIEKIDRIIGKNYKNEDLIYKGSDISR